MILTIPCSGQIDSLNCDTLLLNNGKELTVYIDSLSEEQLFYRLCNSEGIHHRAIARSYILAIRPSIIHKDYPPIQQYINKYEIDPFNYERSVKSDHKIGWVFQHKETNKRIKINKGDMVKVHNRNDIDRSSRKKGRIQNITQTTLDIQTNAALVKIQMSNEISKIEVYSNYWLALVILGSIVAFISFCMTALSVLIGEKSLLVLFTLLTALGIVITSAGMPKTIREPFSGKWEIIKEGVHKDIIEEDQTAPVQEMNMQRA